MAPLIGFETLGALHGDFSWPVHPVHNPDEPELKISYREMAKRYDSVNFFKTEPSSLG